MLRGRAEPNIPRLLKFTAPFLDGNEEGRGGGERIVSTLRRHLIFHQK